jgi:chromosome segregation ATPase
MSKALENLVTSDDAHDLELLFARIDELEGLVKRQKDFIDHSSDTWRRLLSEKQARLEEVMDDRQRIEVESTELVKIKVAHEGKIASLEEKISEFPKILNEERDSVAEENRLLSEKISSLKEEMFDRIGNLEKIGLNLVADTHFSPNVEEYIERISLLEGALATIESELRQREEEIEQTRSALGERLDLIARLERELKDAKALEETLREKLEEANGWVFSLAGERAENEKQLTRLLRDRDAKSKALHDALLQVSRLSSRVDELGARLLSGGRRWGNLFR